MSLHAIIEHKKPPHISSKSITNKIIFDGYYGKLNTGDDAFIEVSAWGAATYWNTTDNFFLAKALPQIKQAASCFQKKLLPGQHALERILHLLNTTAVVSSGGSTFEKPQKLFHIRNLAIFKKALSNTFKLGAIGVSLGPYKNTEDERAVVSYLKRLDFLALRDEYSYQLALSYNLPFKPINAFDLAALLPAIYEDPLAAHTQRSGEKVIGISACYFERYRNHTDLDNEERREAYLKRLLLEITKHTNAKLRFFEFNGHPVVGDQKITASIINFLKANQIDNIEFIPYNPNTAYIYNKVLECNLMLSVRLHASIFACFGNIPFFLLEYHRKCADFLESVGYNEAYRVGDGTKEIQKTVEQIMTILDDKKYYVSPSQIEICKEKALRNFTSVSI